jgi:hypothetical protein
MDIKYVLFIILTIFSTSAAAQDIGFGFVKKNRTVKLIYIQPRKSQAMKSFQYSSLENKSVPFWF